MNISHFTLLPIDNLHAVAVDIGIAIKPIPVEDKVIELDVALITNVLNDFIIVINVLYFLYLFFDLLFCCFFV